MIRSMTGFARQECHGEWGTLVCEMRTVNHRFLEVSLRLPEDLRSLDSELRQLIASALKRGKVDASLHLKSANVAAQSQELNLELLNELRSRLEIVRTTAQADAPVSALDLLRWPGVLKEVERDASPLLLATQELLQQTLEQLNDMRSREGTRIHELLEQRCAAIATQVALVKTRLPEIAARQRERMLARLSTLNTQVDNERLEQELVIFAHKMDVDEEMDRLSSHLVEIRGAIAATEPAGRRLDFLMQELNRESNTLSSKSQDADTTRAAVELKVIIEQMREQIQNVE
ncbi:MAG: YicC/YloC family endoribonuclease [Steroidobacteraceae bacterium]